ncbi:hypothetical protein [uncultured Roseobacter sp.]|uniref:hypothetical protein n=1 Tax=uncultured Roseobacter sp. TaxID=114847 RepID=UPI0026152C14|nr:hypothetical protein [uncultured Roseobacter sp.]
MAVILLHQEVKYGLWGCQSWISESTTLYIRHHLLSLIHGSEDDPNQCSGRVVSIVGSEVKLWGGVGQAVSGAYANTAMLTAVVVYMSVVGPKNRRLCCGLPNPAGGFDIGEAKAPEPIGGGARPPPARSRR